MRSNHKCLGSACVMLQLSYLLPPSKKSFKVYRPLVYICLVLQIMTQKTYVHAWHHMHVHGIVSSSIGARIVIHHLHAIDVYKNGLNWNYYWPLGSSFLSRKCWHHTRKIVALPNMLGRGVWLYIPALTVRIDTSKYSPYHGL